MSERNQYGHRVCPGGLECCQGDSDCDALLAAYDAGAAAERAAVAEVVAGLRREVEARLGDLTAPKGGQRVPFHGDFASAPPSVVSSILWWVRELESALKESK